LSEKLLVREAKRRAEIFANLLRYLKVILDTVRSIDGNAEIYIFGSVTEGRYVLSSDIDILVVTDKPPAEVLKALWENGIEDPFEVHVISRDMLKTYVERAKLIKIEEYINKHAT